MNSCNQELMWKLVKKGRRSKRLLPRRLRWDASTKFCNLASPKRVGDFSGSDTEKFGECFGQVSPRNLGNVPIKKRHCFPSLSLEQKMRYMRPGSHSGDFSGIELLAAAAASMNDEPDNVYKESSVAEDSSLKLKTPGSSVSASSSVSESERLTYNLSEGGNTVGGVLTKAVNRKHWDLNIPMDDWDEPYDSESKDDINMEKGERVSSGCLLSNAAVDTSTEAFDGKPEASGPLFSSQVNSEPESSGRIKNQFLFCDSVSISENYAASISGKGSQTGNLCSNTESADLHGIEDGQSFLTADSNGESCKSLTFGAAKSGSLGHLVFAEVVPYHQSDNQFLEGTNRRHIDSPVDDPTHSDGVCGFDKKVPQVSDISQACTDDGNNSTIIKEGYNSPYEEGELRGSRMHSSEENGDYESDGGNGHETDAADFHEMAEGGTDVSHGAKHVEPGSWSRCEPPLEFTEKSSNSRKRSIMRRSSIQVEEHYLRVRRRMPLTQEASTFRSERSHLNHTDDIEDFAHQREASMWFPRSSRRNHSSSLDSGRSSRKHFPHRSSRSRSRTWNHTSSRSRSRLPDYRSGSRMERVREPKLKQDSAPGYEDCYLPAPRGCPSSQNKCRSSQDSDLSRVKRRSSPTRAFKRPQRHDTTHLKSDDYYRPVNHHSGRFSAMPPSNGLNLESDYYDRRKDGGARTIHRRAAAANRLDRQSTRDV